MKTKMIKQVGAGLIAFTSMVSMVAVGVECEDTWLSGQVCSYKSTATSGGCSGIPTGNPPVCTGTKTITEYSGCMQCAAEGEQSCKSLGCPDICQKRNTVIPCVAVNGYCVEGPALPPGQYFDTPETLCQPG